LRPLFALMSSKRLESFMKRERVKKETKQLRGFFCEISIGRTEKRAYKKVHKSSLVASG
jgi:hypothetical protein